MGHFGTIVQPFHSEVWDNTGIVLLHTFEPERFVNYKFMLDDLRFQSDEVHSFIISKSLPPIIKGYFILEPTSARLAQVFNSVIGKTIEEADELFQNMHVDMCLDELLSNMFNVSFLSHMTFKDDLVEKAIKTNIDVEGEINNYGQTIGPFAKVLSNTVNFLIIRDDIDDGYDRDDVDISHSAFDDLSRGRYSDVNTGIVNDYTSV